MAAYGNAALRAAELVRQDACLAPDEAWNRAIAEVYPYSQSSQTKACPRGTFLGLCSNGEVVGIPPGNYTKSAKNKLYGIRALELLRKSPALANDELTLWKKVISEQSKVPNCQMEVVIALWKNGLVLK